jgi:hypothetical protein
MLYNSFRFFAFYKYNFYELILGGFFFCGEKEDLI